jgi:hypothetical protein
MPEVDDGDLPCEQSEFPDDIAIARRQVEVELGYLGLNLAIARMGNYGGWSIGPP